VGFLNFKNHSFTLLLISYALSELRRDVEEELLNHPEPARATLRETTKFAVFVVHNKSTNPKKAEIPAGVLSVQPSQYCYIKLMTLTICRYFSGAEVGNVW
jgi:hypothetical protein